MTCCKSYFLYRIKNFSPAWFAVTMGLGISSVILYTFPFSAEWLKVLGVIMWGFNMGVFALANVFLVLRFVLFPDQFSKMLHHPGQSVFLGCYPMGFATIINMTADVFGARAWRAVYVMWWIDVVASLFAAWYVVFVMYSAQSRTSETIFSTILLPVVALVVASSTGSIIVPLLPEHLRIHTTVISAMLWGNGELIGFICTTIYVHRLLLHNLPPAAIAISTFLPLGPLGQGAFGIQNIATDVAELLVANGMPASRAILVHYAGIAIAIVMLGTASFWVFIATMGVIHSKPKVFNLGWWGLTFPLGTFVIAWYKLGENTGFLTFKVVGCIFGVVELLLALACIYYTCLGAVFHDLVFHQVEMETSPEDSIVNPGKADDKV